MPYLMPWGLKEVRSDMANYAGNVRSSANDQTDRLICPKPQRVPATLRPAQPSPSSSSSSFRLWRSLSPAAAATAADGGSEAPGHEILEIFLSKASPVTPPTDSYGYGYGYGVSPPYFAGSPPSRAANPLVRDSTFVHLTSCSPGSGSSFTSTKPNPSTAGGKVGIVKSNKSNTTVRASSPSIRIEGFECTGRDTRRRVPAFA